MAVDSNRRTDRGAQGSHSSGDEQVALQGQSPNEGVFQGLTRHPGSCGRQQVGISVISRSLHVVRQAT